MARSSRRSRLSTPSITCWKRWSFGVSVPGFPSLIVSIMFFAGVQLISLGVLGEYIGRVFAEVKGRPLYLVAENIDRRPGGQRVTRSGILAKAVMHRRLHRQPSARMFKSFLSVSGFTLLSRLTGLLRDVLLSGMRRRRHACRRAFRWPCDCPIIFAPFSAKAPSTPPMSRPICAFWSSRATRRRAKFRQPDLHLAADFAGGAAGAGLAVHAEFVDLLAPGFAAYPEKFALAVSLTRITFPYLFCITLVTMHSATLNAHGKFAVPAFAPVLLNVVTIGLSRHRLPVSQRGLCGGVRRHRVSGVAQLAPADVRRRAGMACWKNSRGRAGAPTCARSSACSGRR